LILWQELMYYISSCENKWSCGFWYAI